MRTADRGRGRGRLRKGAGAVAQSAPSAKLVFDVFTPIDAILKRVARTAVVPAFNTVFPAIVAIYHAINCSADGEGEGVWISR